LRIEAGVEEPVEKYIADFPCKMLLA
jgi:hypothetical protein